MATAPRVVLLLGLGLACAACKSDPPAPKPHGSQQAPVASAAPRAVCTFGADQTCNDDPLLSSIHGTCNQDGTCTCQPGFKPSSTSGRCK
jgi:hypothetical protein